MVLYYHYTTETGAAAILKSKKILPSAVEGPDAAAGVGCYFITLDPETHTQEEVAKFQYGTAWQSTIRSYFYTCLVRMFIINVG